MILNLLKAFESASALANRRRLELVADHVATGLISPDDAGRAGAAVASARHQGQPDDPGNLRRLFARAGPDAAPDEARGHFRREH